MYCTQCKCCLAQPNFKLCVFCEDGFLCPNRKRAAQPVVTATKASNIGVGATGTTVPTTTESEPRSNEGRSVPAAAAASSKIPQSPSADNSCGTVEGHGRTEHCPASQGDLRGVQARSTHSESQPSPAGVSTSTQALTPGRVRRHARASGVLRRESTEALGGNHSAQVTKNSPAPSSKKTSSKENDMSLKPCRYPGCKEMIHADNQLGACKQHRYWAKKNPADGSASTSKRSKTANGKARTSPPQQFRFQPIRERLVFSRGHHLHHRAEPRFLLAKAFPGRESRALPAAA